MHRKPSVVPLLMLAVVTAAVLATAATAGPPEYEPAYYDGQTVTINAIDVRQNPTEQAQADLYEVVYPVGWESYGLAPPQCNPCDHQHNGIDFTDYHDHVLDSIPASPGHGEYTPLWHVWVIMPVYTGVASHDNAVSAAYAAHLPATSEDAAESLTHLTLADGSPVATQIDTHFYFVCAVVSDHAAH